MKAIASAHNTKTVRKPWRRRSRGTCGEVDPLGKADRGCARCGIGSGRRTIRNEGEVATGAQLAAEGLMLRRRGARVVNQLLIDRDRRLCRFMVYRSDGGQGFECARAVCESKRR